MAMTTPYPESTHLEAQQAMAAYDAFERILHKKYKNAPTEFFPGSDSLKLSCGRHVRLEPSDNRYRQTLRAVTSALNG